MPSSLTASSQARHAVGELLADHPDTLSQDAALLTSELVANCVLHAAAGPVAWIALRAEVLPGAVRVEVTDAGVGFVPRWKPPEPGQVGGMGLYIVDRVADRWGVLQDRLVTVWFELWTEPAQGRHRRMPNAQAGGQEPVFTAARGSEAPWRDDLAARRGRRGRTGWVATTAEARRRRPPQR